MYCIKCGSEIPEGAVFCPKCGTKQETEQKQESDQKASIIQNTASKNQNRKTVLSVIVMVVVLLAVILGFILLTMHNKKPKAPELTAEEERIVTECIQIKDNLRNPDSFKLYSVIVRDTTNDEEPNGYYKYFDMIEFGATNGYGAMDKDTYIYCDGAYIGDSDDLNELNTSDGGEWVERHKDDKNYDLKRKVYFDALFYILFHEKMETRSYYIEIDCDKITEAMAYYQ